MTRRHWLSSVLLVSLLSTSPGCDRSPQAEQTTASSPSIEALPAPSGSSEPLGLTVDAGEYTRGLGPAMLVVEGYPSSKFSPHDLPLAHAEAGFRWSSDAPIDRWPIEEAVQIPVDASMRLLAWLDFNQSGRLDTGDHYSASLLPAPAAANAAGELEQRRGNFKISHIYVSRAAMARQVSVQVQFTGDKETTSRNQGRLALFGFTKEQLGDQGFPSEQPVFEWHSEGRRRSWPTSVEIMLPVEPELWLFPVLNPSQGDHLDDNARYGVPKAAFKPKQAESAPLLLQIDEGFNSAEGERRDGEPGQ